MRDWYILNITKQYMNGLSPIWTPLLASKAICTSKITTNLARKLVDVVILPLTVWVFVILFHFFGLLTPVCANLLCVGIVVIHAACAS